jgi:hypothetical protein
VAGEGEIWEIWEWREKWKIWSEPDVVDFSSLIFDFWIFFFLNKKEKKQLPRGSRAGLQPDS